MPSVPAGTRTNTDNKALQVAAALKPETHLKPNLRDYRAIREIYDTSKNLNDP
jgi:hypothetical protein